MSRLIDKPVRVAASSQGRPRRFFWRGKSHKIHRVLEIWLDIGAWWQGEQEKVFWRLETRTGGVFELYHESEDKQTWFLYKIYD
jgi:hypothetical protein